jgi:NADPH-dependent 2,4-dienoyl-CoA reductase/sulfur reductase-like enzyme/peroxiredoxin family protein/TusA-related sulfurtransferase/rhodanese-related sulfurtransferase
MKSSQQRVLIIGGVAAGASTAARARRLSEGTLITLVERGPDVSFANCGLPYHIGGEISARDRLALQTPESLSALLGIEVLTRTEAVAINRDKKTVNVRKLADGTVRELPYDKLVLAPGASPLRPPLPGIDHPKIHSLRSLQDMDAIKAAAASATSALVIGGGFIGLEMAEQLRRLGKAVTLVELSKQVLPQLDPEMVAPIEAELKARGVTLLLGDAAEEFASSGNAVSVRLKSGREIKADMVLLSIGVRAESSLAAAAGLELGARGTIKVNEWMQTSDPDIYAAGDAVESADRIFGAPMNLALGGPANRQGRVIASHIFQKNPQAYPGHIGTAIVRVFNTTAGITGFSEKFLAQKNIPYESTVVTDFHHAGYYPGAAQLTLKLLWSPEDGRVLGAQVFGAEGVDKRLDVVATAIAGRMGIDDLSQLELAYAPPFGSARDVVNTAGFVAQNQRDGLARFVREIPSGRRVLDVRPRAVSEINPILGAVNIPLAELRARLGELDKHESWAAVCVLGKTSYFAARILKQNGFDVVNVSGGLKLAEKAEDKVPPPASGGTSSPTAAVKSPSPTPVETLDCTGLSCPGPLLQVKAQCETLAPGSELRVLASDPGFERDAQAFCRATGHELLEIEREKGGILARLRKPAANSALPSSSGSLSPTGRRKGATVVVFSGEMDKVMASLVIANGAAAMGGKVTMFFTFWGLNALRKERVAKVSGKSFPDRMFGWMLPRGLKALPLSKMNFGGFVRAMMKHQVTSKNLPNLPGLLGTARFSGVRFIACTMSMEATGIRAEELIDGIEFGGVADYLDSAEQSGTNLFI